MRTGVAFNAADSASGLGPWSAAAAVPTSPPQAGGGPRSAWHSPVPYLFGGLAAMLGLIALALLILACSYWRVSSYLESADAADAGPSDGPEKPGDASDQKNPAFLEERYLVIMPGDCAPSVLAVPIAIHPPSAAAHNATDSSSKSSADAAEQGGQLSPPNEATQEH